MILLENIPSSKGVMGLPLWYWLSDSLPAYSPAPPLCGLIIQNFIQVTDKSENKGRLRVQLNGPLLTTPISRASNLLDASTCLDHASASFSPRPFTPRLKLLLEAHDTQRVSSRRVESGAEAREGAEGPWRRWGKGTSKQEFPSSLASTAASLPLGQTPGKR